MNDYEPYDCQICKMCKSVVNPLYDCGEVICKKHEIREDHCYENFYDTYKPGVYDRLKNKCRCNKVYPSKWKMFWFRVSTFFRKRADKKYHRNEVLGEKSICDEFDMRK